MYEKELPELAFDIKPNHNVKRLRAILDQIVPGIVADLEDKGIEKYKIDHLNKLQESAYKLVNEQERYTEEQVHAVFEGAYQELDDFIKSGDTEF